MDVSSVYRQTAQPISPTNASQPTQNRATRPDDADLKKAAEVKEAQPPKPVVNSQGQTTGRIVNTTA